MRRSGEGEKGRCFPWSKEEEGTYIFWMKQVPVTRIILLLESLLYWWAELRTMLRHLNMRGLNGITWALLAVYNLQRNMRQVQPETLPKNSNFSSCLQNIKLKNNTRPYLKLYSWKPLISCSRRSQWMRMRSGKWLKIRCYSLWVRDFPFHCFIFIWKKK